MSDTLEQLLDAAIGSLTEARQLVQPPPPPVSTDVTHVRPGDSLQAALDAGGVIAVDAGTYEGAFVARKPGTVLLGGPGVTLHATNTAALTIPAGAHGILLSDIACQSTGNVVVQLGSNDATVQSRLEDVPHDLLLRRVSVPTHRGKRGIECNARAVAFDHCTVADVWNPGGNAGPDTQALAILNSPGEITIIGGAYSAGSEGILVGGDLMKIPGVIPTDIAIRGVTISRPLTWRTDGIVRKVKNLLEFKTGHRIRVDDLVLDGCWHGEQDGSAIVITPHSGGDIADVQITGVSVRNCSGVLQVLGQEYKGVPTPAPLRGLVVTGVNAVVSKSFGGRGIFALISGEPGDLVFDRNVVVSDGTSVILYDPGKVLTGADTTTTRAGGPIASLTVTNNFLVPGPYGILLAGVINAGPSPNGATVLTVTGNTFADAAATLKKNLPANVYLTRAEWDAAVAAR